MLASWWTGLVAAVFVAAAAWWASRRLAEGAVRRFFRPPRRPPRPLPAILKPRAEDVTVPGPLVPTKAWLLRPRGAPRGLAVFAHGWTSDGSRLAPMAIPLLDARVACLLWDLPGHGRSPAVATYNVPLLIRDLKAARDWLDGLEGLEQLPKALVGYSFGGLGALLTPRNDPRWDALVSLGTPVSPMDAIELYLKQRGLPSRLLRGLFHGALHRVAGVDPGSLEILAHLAALNAPLLVIHGDADEVVPVAHARAIVAAAPEGRATLAVIAGARHDGLMTHPDACARLTAFLLETFGRVPRAV